MTSAVPSQVEDALEAIRSGMRPADLESVTLDFKRAKESFDAAARDLAEAASCFAPERA